MTGCGIKLVEKAVAKLTELLTTSDPFRGLPCTKYLGKSSKLLRDRASDNIKALGGTHTSRIITSISSRHPAEKIDRTNEDEEHILDHPHQ